MGFWLSALTYSFCPGFLGSILENPSLGLQFNIPYSTGQVKVGKEGAKEIGKRVIILMAKAVSGVQVKTLKLDDFWEVRGLAI
jgi:hypothetical protein